VKTAKTGAAPRVVVVGAGFGGIWAAKTLARGNFDTLVVDRANYHTFFPLLYQVAAAELDPEQIAYPVRGVFRGLPNVGFALAEVLSIDFSAKVLRTDGPDIPYEYLVLALGSETNFFGVPGAKEHAFGLKTLEEGIALRNQIMTCFERASRLENPTEQRQALTFAVAGGGPTGVEYAGALAELIRGPLAKDYPLLNISQARVVLLEGGSALLAGFPPHLQHYALIRLGRMGVEVRLGAQVSRVTPEAVLMEDGSALATDTLVWTAGVKGASRSASFGLKTLPNGRAPVLPTLQSAEHPDVYLVGDMTHFEQNGRPLPMIAPVAIQQGKLAARNILRQEKGKKLKNFKYHDRGTLATIGRNSAVACLAGRTWSGLTAWALWLFIHLAALIGFRNRLLVLMTWAVDYVFFERSVRLILPKSLGRSAKDAPEIQKSEP
jgi:NADH dehydrogenase